MDKKIIEQIEFEQEDKLVALENKVAEEQKKVEEKEEEAYDSFSGEKIKMIPSPNYTDCQSIGTFIPVNMAGETVSNLSKLAAKFDFVEFVKEKLAYSSRLAVANSFSSEQIDSLVLAITQFEKGNAFIIGDQAGIGKGRSQPNDAKILTPDGWKTMGIMKIGSNLFTKDGSITKVEGVFPQGKIDVYEVLFSDGSKTECSLDHLWNVLNKVDKYVKNNTNYKTRTLKELMVGDLEKNRYTIPLVEAIKFNYKEVPIDPYLLGVLLGDACIRECGVELTSADDEILDSVSLSIEDDLCLKKTREYHYQISKKKQKCR